LKRTWWCFWLLWEPHTHTHIYTQTQTHTNTHNNIITITITITIIIIVIINKNVNINININTNNTQQHTFKESTCQICLECNKKRQLRFCPVLVWFAQVMFFPIDFTLAFLCVLTFVLFSPSISQSHSRTALGRTHDDGDDIFDENWCHNFTGANERADPAIGCQKKRGGLTR
jgi:hypothetical protein